MTTRALVQLALVLTIVFGAQARLLPYLPGDVTVARGVQALPLGRAWVEPVVDTARSPTKYLLMAIAVLGAWRMAGARAALVVVAAIVLEQTFGEASKTLFDRPRPSRELIAVMGNPTGLSFPSTFMTLHSVTIGALVLLALPTVRTHGRTVVVAGVAILVVAACARLVPGAHWPSDVIGTVAICLSWLAAAFSAVGAPSSR